MTFLAAFLLTISIFFIAALWSLSKNMAREAAVEADLEQLRAEQRDEDGWDDGEWVRRYGALVLELRRDFHLSDHNARAILARASHLFLGDS